MGILRGKKNKLKATVTDDECKHVMCIHNTPYVSMSKRTKVDPPIRNNCAPTFLRSGAPSIF